MYTLKRTTLALAVATAGTVGLMAATPAQAYVQAESLIDMTNFRILGADGQILDATGANTASPTGDFAVLTFTSTADMSVSLIGSSAQNPSGATAPIDFNPICVGISCPVFANNNDFTQYSAPPIGEYASADQLEVGAPVDNLAGFPDPAHVASVSAVGLLSSVDDASANSNNNLNSSFKFVLNNSQAITFAFDLDAYLQVAMTKEEQYPGTATASYQMSFTITTQAGTPVWAWNVDVFDNGFNTLSLNAPLLDGLDVETILQVDDVSFSKKTPTLTAGVAYQLSARINTNADATRVPEPSALALLAIGLLGVGATRIRRRYA